VRQHGRQRTSTDCPLWSDLAAPDVPSAASDGCWGCLTGPGHWSLGSIAWRFHRGRSPLDKYRARDQGAAVHTDERLALAGFLAGYSGLTREAYTLDLR
jgi:hypothetical protein